MSWKINPEWEEATHHVIFASQFLPGAIFDGLSLEQAVEKLEKEREQSDE